MRNRQTSTLLSVGIHVTAAVLLFTVTTNPGGMISARSKPTELTTLIAPRLKLEEKGGGGGGGDRSLLRASKGALPKAAARQFAPPVVVEHNPEPKLIVEPTIVVASNAALPQLNMTQFGDPMALAGPPSNGRGSGGGIGEGEGGGVGPGKGIGYGPGNNYGTGGGVPPAGARSRGSITPCALIWKIEPEYSDEARRAKVQGTVLLYLEVDSEGKPRNIQVRQGLGLGLDERAIEAVMRWKFRPGRQNGQPVTTTAQVEVNFRLL